jgi:hypothetical protein
MDEVNCVAPDAESSQAETSLTPTRRRFAMPPAGRRKRRAVLAEPAPGSRRGAPRSPRRPASSLAEPGPESTESTSSIESHRSRRTLR